MNQNKVKVFVVGPSIDEIEALTKRLGGDPRLAVSEICANVYDVTVQARLLRPDVVLMPSRWGVNCGNMSQSPDPSYAAYYSIYLAAALKEGRVRTVVYERDSGSSSHVAQTVFEALGATFYTEGHPQSLADMVCKAAQI